MACKNRTAQSGLIFHSGQGVQYCAASFREKPRELCPAARQSMSRKGNCRDNARAESFFKTLKREMETLDGKRPAAEVRQPVFMYYQKEKCIIPPREFIEINYESTTSP
jgi:transposase InsO family protein